MARDARDILLPWKLSAHLRMGFFSTNTLISRAFTDKSYTALNWCIHFQETVEWQQAHCPMLGRSLTPLSTVFYWSMMTGGALCQPCGAAQLLAQSSRKLFGTPLPELLSYFSLNIGLMQESLQAGGFTDNEVTLVIDGRSHILSLTAQRLPEGFILLEMAPMDNQRRLSEQLQHAQQVAARDLVRGPAHEIKTR